MADEGLEEPGSVLLVVAEGPEDDEDAEAALAGDPSAGGDVLARLLLDVELDPLASVRVDGARDELVLGQVAKTKALTRLEDHARRADELRHDHALGAVDDERSLVRHDREVAHEDRLFLDLAGLPVLELGPHEDRGRVGHVLFLALLDGELRNRLEVRVVRIELEVELEVLGEVLDRTHVPERVGQSLVEEPVEGLALNCDEVREFEGVLDVVERIPVADGRASWQGDDS